MISSMPFCPSKHQNVRTGGSCWLFVGNSLVSGWSKRSCGVFMVLIPLTREWRINSSSTARISQTQLTKAAWIALVNNQTTRAIRMLKQSDSKLTDVSVMRLALMMHCVPLQGDTLRMLSSFLQQGRIDQAVAKELRLSDPYMRAMVNYLAGGSSWELTINDPDLPLLDRTVLAIRFVNDAAVSATADPHPLVSDRALPQLSTFLDNQIKKAQQDGALQGIPLTGLGSAGMHVISRYVDVTGDIQVAAILGSTCRQPSAQVTRCIEDYRDLLDAWALYRARVMFDMSRGNISRWYGDEIKTMKQVIVRCNFCQKNITGSSNRSQTAQNKTRVSLTFDISLIRDLTRW
jgi:hypothetical protein